MFFLNILIDLKGFLAHKQRSYDLYKILKIVRKSRLKSPHLTPELFTKPKLRTFSARKKHYLCLIWKKNWTSNPSITVYQNRTYLNSIKEFQTMDWVGFHLTPIKWHHVTALKTFRNWNSLNIILTIYYSYVVYYLVSVIYISINFKKVQTSSLKKMLYVFT